MNTDELKLAARYLSIEAAFSCRLIRMLFSFFGDRVILNFKIYSHTFHNRETLRIYFPPPFVTSQMYVRES